MRLLLTLPMPVLTACLLLLAKWQLCDTPGGGAGRSFSSFQMNPFLSFCFVPGTPSRRRASRDTARRGVTESVYSIYTRVKDGNQSKEQDAYAHVAACRVWPDVRRYAVALGLLCGRRFGGTGYRIPYQKHRTGFCTPDVGATEGRICASCFTNQVTYRALSRLGYP